MDLFEDANLYQELLVGLPDAVLVLDSSKHILYANHEAERIFGNGSALVGSHFGTPIHRGTESSVQLITKEGIRQGEMRVRPIQLGGEARTLVVLRDVTEIVDMKNLYRRALLSIISTLATTLEHRDPYTSGHESRVALLAHAIARELGCDDECCEGLYIAAMVHDIGKIAIPSEILTKPGRLREEEFNLIKTHSEVGFEILKDNEFPWPVAEIIYQHHERIDGSGYPRGLKGDQILDQAKILAVADVAEAIMNTRPYRSGMGLDNTLEILEQQKGITLDLESTQACIDLFKENRFSFEIDPPAYLNPHVRA